LAAVLLALLCLLPLSACGLLGSAETPASSGLTKVKIVRLKLVDAVPLHLAIDQGFFKDEGIEVVLSDGQKGSDNVAKVLSGEQDLGLTSYPPAITAHDKVKKLRVVYDAVQTQPDSVVVVVKKDGPIKKIEDLVGKKIANSSPKGISELAMNEQFRMHGIDPTAASTKVTYAPGEIAEMPGLVESGTVAAAIIAEPYVQISYKQGNQKLLDPFTGPAASFPWSGFVATADWVKKNPETVKKVQNALRKGAELAKNDRAKAEAALIEHVNVDKTNAPLTVMPEWPISVDPVRLQRVVDLMRRNGEKGVDKNPIYVDMRTMMVDAA
jgi:NitT/TauT family transport system substrate-binding protein